MANETTLPQPLANPIPGIAVGTGAVSSATGNSTAQRGQNPLLVPDFYTPVEINGVVAQVSPNDLLAQSGYVRTAASVTATVTDSTADTDSVTVTFTNGVLSNSGGPRTVTATNPSTTNSTMAEAIANAINSDPVLQAFQISATVAAAVVTINQLGPVGNYTTVSYADVSGSVVLTFSPSSGTLAGGAGSVWPFNSFRYTFNGQTFEVRSRQPIIISPPILAAMVRDAMPIA
jgi:hypothetical protein